MMLERREQEEGRGHRYFLADRIPGIGSTVVLEPEESRHVLRSLRLRPGDTLSLTDGRGSRAYGLIETVMGDRIRVRVTGTEIDCEPAWAKRIVIALGRLRRRDRMEWAVEKCTEIGAGGFAVFTSQRSIARGGRTSGMLDRLRRVSVAALKQSGRTWLPDLWAFDSLEELLAGFSGARVLFADPGGARVDSLREVFSGAERVLALVGPEGGFAPRESAVLSRGGAVGVDLGAFRLRSETACVVLCSHLVDLAREADPRQGGRLGDARRGGR